MKEIKTTKDIHDMPVMVRVIANTKHPKNKERNDMVGGEFEVTITSHYDNERVLLNEKSNSWTFSEEDLQVLIPVKYNGVTIGIGDMVNGYEVHGFHWYDRWMLDVVKDEYMNGGCDWFQECDIESHTPLHPQSPKMSDEEMIAELTKRGRLKEGVILE